MVKLALHLKKVISFAVSLVVLNQKALFLSTSKMLWLALSVQVQMLQPVCLHSTTSLNHPQCSKDLSKTCQKLLRLVAYSLGAVLTVIKYLIFCAQLKKAALKSVKSKIHPSGLLQRTMIKRNLQMMMNQSDLA